uniref:Uncharacterized protein n=1 Tax=Anguilla anguilla TaxID=7936 RepID=A0A0E9WQB0_ANGAN
MLQCLSYNYMCSCFCHCIGQCYAVLCSREKTDPRTSLGHTVISLLTVNTIKLYFSF